MSKFRLVEGNHYVDGRLAEVGEVLDLTDEQAINFRDKFRALEPEPEPAAVEPEPVVVPAAVEPEPVVVPAAVPVEE